MNFCSGIQKHAIANDCAVLDTAILQKHTAITQVGVRTDIGTGRNDVRKSIPERCGFLIHLRPDLLLPMPPLKVYNLYVALASR